MTVIGHRRGLRRRRPQRRDRRPRRPARRSAARLRGSRALAAHGRYVRPAHVDADARSSSVTPTSRSQWPAKVRAARRHAERAPPRAPTASPCRRPAEEDPHGRRAPHPDRPRLAGPHHPRDAGLPRARTSGPTSRPSTSSSTSAASRTTPPTPCPGFTDRLLELLPGPDAAHLLAGPRAAASSSGCTRAPGSATSPSTSRCSCSGGRPRPAPRQDPRRQGPPGRYNVIYGYIDEQVGLAAGQLAVRLRQPPRPARGGLRLPRAARRLPAAGRADGLRAVDRGDPRGGGQPRHPLDPAQQRVARPARPGRPRPAHPRHDDVEDRRPGRRHRRRQGPHRPSCSARPGCPVPAQESVRTARGAVDGRRPDRLPRRGQAARRQPRPRGLPGPPVDADEVEQGLRHRRGRVARGHGHRRVLRHRPRLPLPHRRRPDAGDRRAGAGPRRRRRRAHRGRAGRDHQRRPPARRRPREGAHQDQGRRRRRGGRCADQGYSLDVGAHPPARWSSSR